MRIFYSFCIGLLLASIPSPTFSQERHEVDSAYLRSLISAIDNGDTFRIISKSDSIIQNSQNPSERMGSILVKAYLYINAGEQDKGIKELKILLDSARYYNDSVMTLVTINNLGTTLRSVGQYNVAMAYLIESLNYLNKDTELNYRGATYQNIGALLILLDNREEAKEYLEKAYPIFIETNDSLKLGRYYHQYGEILQLEDSINQAIAYFNQAGDIYRSLGDSNGLGENYFHFGRLFFEQGNLERATRYLLKCFEHIEDNPTGSDLLAKANYIYGQIKLQQNALNEARDLTAAALDYAIQAKDQLEVIDCYELLSEINYRDRRYEEAFHYQKLAKQAMNNIAEISIDAEVERVRHQDLMIQREREERDRQSIEELETNNHHLERTIFWLILGFSAALLLSFLYLSKIRLKLLRANKTIDKDDAIIEQLRRDLEEAEQNIHELSSERSSFGRMMRAELLAPLEAIQLTGEHMLKQSVDSEARVRIQSIMLHVANLKTLFAEAFEYSKAIHNKIELNFEPFQFLPFLKEIEEASHAWNWRSDNSFTLNTPDDLPKIIFSDRKALYLILKNLLNNSFQHNRKCHVELTLRYSQVEETLNGQKLHMQFEIEDNGEGMDKDTLDQIRETFESRRLTIMPQITGSGLGISVTARLIHAFGGEATIASSKRGTRITLNLPLKVKF